MLWLEQRWPLEPGGVAILPVGAVEAHGPHLPLGTDGLISEAMAREGARILNERAVRAVILPTWHFTVASFAREFAGTLCFSPELVGQMLRELAAGLSGYQALAIANSHLDPAHLASLRAGLSGVEIPVAFPDLTRRRLAARLTEEFQSGACHAGQYEGSIVAAVRPDLVEWDVARKLPNNPCSLVTAIRAGAGSFAEAGGPQAYFGSPQGISVEEGHRTIAVLGEILAEAVLEVTAASD